jgi:hypothetical protein
MVFGQIRNKLRPSHTGTEREADACVLHFLMKLHARLEVGLITLRFAAVIYRAFILGLTARGRRGCCQRGSEFRLIPLKKEREPPVSQA